MITGWILAFLLLAVCIYMIGSVNRYREQVRYLQQAHKLKMENLEEYRNLLGHVIEQIPQEIILTDLNGVIRYVNPKVLQVIGCSRHELIGRRQFDLIEDDCSRQSALEAHEKARHGGAWKGVFVRTAVDGRRYEIESMMYPVRSREGAITHVVEFGRDIAYEKNLEAQLRQSQKLEAIGTLAGGIAHDFNNILSAIIGYAELTLLKHKVEGGVCGNIEHIREAGERARDLIAQILLFSRRVEGEKKPIHVHGLITEVIKMLRAVIPATIDIRYTAEDKDLIVVGDTAQVHQIIMNLCTNAYQAMEELNTGVLSITMRRSVIEEGEALPDEKMQHMAPYVSVEVSDSGHGILEENLDHIFDPFFSTKEEGKGTGLGLSVVHGIVRNMKGGITVNSEPGRGATFTIYLPESSISVRRNALTGEEPIPGDQTILYVDDDEMVVTFVEAALQELGYKPLVYTCAEDALQALIEGVELIDMAIVDLVMPGLTGDAVIQKVREIRPNLPIALCTGSKDRLQALEKKGFKVDQIIWKPFNIHSLTSTIHATLQTQEA